MLSTNYYYRTPVLEHSLLKMITVVAFRVGYCTKKLKEKPWHGFLKSSQKSTSVQRHDYCSPVQQFNLKKGNQPKTKINQCCGNALGNLVHIYEALILKRKVLASKLWICRMCWTSENWRPTVSEGCQRSTAALRKCKFTRMDKC